MYCYYRIDYSTLHILRKKEQLIPQVEPSSPEMRSTPLGVELAIPPILSGVAEVSFGLICSPTSLDVRRSKTSRAR